MLAPVAERVGRGERSRAPARRRELHPRRPGHLYLLTPVGGRTVGAVSVGNGTFSFAPAHPGRAGPACAVPEGRFAGSPVHRGLVLSLRRHHPGRAGRRVEFAPDAGARRVGGSVKEGLEVPGRTEDSRTFDPDLMGAFLNGETSDCSMPTSATERRPAHVHGSTRTSSRGCGSRARVSAWMGSGARRSITQFPRRGTRRPARRAMRRAHQAGRRAGATPSNRQLLRPASASSASPRPRRSRSSRTPRSGRGWPSSCSRS